ncbi:hypothetical protein GUJ93_ZPchr0012g21741 [Zizania palustris]|uniref:Uncharacterized protein n=1 Tax=Zizania palustris TaxID=103762 RepID=A0A8J5WTY2_ZIZPA|nr:hypothetical protein GUJ93_ZPchr0012g21741 [Zizania palustris]
MGTLAYPHVISQLHCVDGPPSGRGLLMDPVHRTRCVATVTSWYLCTMLVGCDDLEDMENLGFQCHSRAHIMSANSLGKRMTFCFLSRMEHGGTRGATSWLALLQPWIDGWLDVVQDVHDEENEYDPMTFHDYLRWYSIQTMVCLIIGWGNDPRPTPIVTQRHLTHIAAA